jgi:translocation and assembly module TamB
MKRHFIGFWISALLLLGFGLGTLCFLVSTPQGLVLLSHYVEKKLPGKLTIEKLEGRLIGPLHLTGIHYQSSDLQLVIPSLTLDWDASALLQGQFAIRSLQIVHPIVTITTQKKSSPTSNASKIEFKKPWLLHFIQLDAFSIQQASIHWNQNTLTLNGFLDKQWHVTGQLHISNLKPFVTQVTGQFDVDGAIKGERANPIIELTMPTTTLQWQDQSFQGLQAKFHLDTARTRIWTGEIQLNQLKKQAFSFNHLQLNLEGQLQPFSLRGTFHPFNLSYQDTATFSTKNTWPLPSSHLAIDSSAQGWKISLDTDPKVKAQQLHFLAELPRIKKHFYPSKHQTGQGYLTLHLITLDYLKFIPLITRPQGSVQARLDFSGALLSPTLHFSASLQNGQVQIPDLGLDIKQINFACQTHENQLQGFGYLQSGQGLLNFSSLTQWNQTDLVSQITIEGKNVMIANTPEYKIMASPKLHIDATTQSLHTTGEILFPEVTIHLDNQTTHLAELSDDIIFVAPKEETQNKLPTLPFRYDNQVNLILGDTHFNYRGLQAQVKGRLAVQQRTAHPTLATGELALIQGAYHYYGQTLPLDADSLLRFVNSPIDNPNLNISASKAVAVFPKDSNDAKGSKDSTDSKLGSSDFISDALQIKNQAIQTTVRLHIQGNLKNPKLTLSAEPAYAINSQLDMLSYLILGSPSNQLSPGRGIQLLLSAATHLDNQEQNKVEQFIDRAQKSMGIDQLTIGNNPIFNPEKGSLQQNTSLIIRKKFSPRLDVSYSVGLLDPINILQVNYLLNKYFSLQATNSSFASGVDLIYNFEK